MKKRSLNRQFNVMRPFVLSVILLIVVLLISIILDSTDIQRNKSQIKTERIFKTSDNDNN